MKKWYPEFFYLLATLDYISRINNIPLCKEYNDIKQNKLKVVLYPSSIIAMSLAMQDESFKEKAMIFFHHCFSIIFNISSFKTETISSCFTFLIISPFLISSPSLTPPAIPISACLASPGPLTAHPIIATVISL